MPFNNIATNQRTLDNFKARLAAGGARPNLFEVELYFPTLSDSTDFGSGTDGEENWSKPFN